MLHFCFIYDLNWMETDIWVSLRNPKVRWRLWAQTHTSHPQADRSVVGSAAAVLRIVLFVHYVEVEPIYPVEQNKTFRWATRKHVAPFFKSELNIPSSAVVAAYYRVKYLLRGTILRLIADSYSYAPPYWMIAMMMLVWVGWRHAL